jgi:hypothetical protein
VSDTKRGLIIFFAGLLTIALWVPHGNEARRSASGKITTETQVGLFNYMTVEAELQEPRYSITPIPNYQRLALTVGATIVLWGGVIIWCRKGRRATGDHRPPPWEASGPE